MLSTPHYSQVKKAKIFSCTQYTSMNTNFAYTDPSLCDIFVDKTSSKFKMSMMGKMSIFLRLQISQSSKGIFINQTKYSLEILKKYGMESSNTVDNPMVERTNLDEDLQRKIVDPTYYRVLMPRVVKSRDEIFSRWGYCDNHDLSRLDNQSIERDRLIGIGFVLNFVKFISFTFGDKEMISVIEAVSR
ncbi:retrovirus-related pol polyprotein from transposon TNT 1-94 [Tanacetum coccineum]